MQRNFSGRRKILCLFKLSYNILVKKFNVLESGYKYIARVYNGLKGRSKLITLTKIQYVFVFHFEFFSDIENDLI